MLKKENIHVLEQSMDAEEALKAIGQVLLDAGSITEQYIENMIKIYHDIGPYFVIAPGIAIAHAKPDESVIDNDVALLLCRKPVVFNSKNDPVSLLFGICSTNGNGHMDGLIQLSELLSDEEKVNQMKQVTSNEELFKLLDLGE